MAGNPPIYSAAVCRISYVRMDSVYDRIHFSLCGGYDNRSGSSVVLAISIFHKVATRTGRIASNNRKFCGDNPSSWRNYNIDIFSSFKPLVCVGKLVSIICSSKGNRTPISALKGQRPSR